MKTTSFAGLFMDRGVRAIEIPMLQRDYAQGRQSEEVSRIRRDFLGVLYDALTGGPPVSLDFVYGEIKDGTLIPLDGQQRLTTLFLLHWYLAARAGVPDEAVRLLPALTYETRASSRAFCQALEAHRTHLPIEGPGAPRPAAWVRDQPWFFAAWRHDPSIESMLAVLDDIDGRFRCADCTAAWRLLADGAAPAVSFHLLAIDDLGLTDDLYIKMNSRGKPLTPFERFKAGFEDTIRRASRARYEEFIQKIDNVWSDVLWRCRGDELIDSSFMRYLRYVTDMLAYRDRIVLSGEDGERAEQIYGSGNAQAEKNLAFLFSALDCWHGEDDVAAWFQGAFTARGHEPGKTALFESVDLFGSCCRDYGVRRFPLSRSLMLFAVLIHLQEGTSHFEDRIRTLRNLVVNSEDEIRVERMPGLLDEVCGLVREGRLSAATGFNRHQAAEEAAKASFLAANQALTGALRRLEDHRLLRGCLAAFELEPARFECRAATFEEIFVEGSGITLSAVGASLLACGDYSQRNRLGRYQLGAPGREEIWRQLFTNHASTARMPCALMQLLDEVGPSGEPVVARLGGVVRRYRARQKAAGEFDWRYYLVTYDEMREGDSGLYASAAGVMGLDLCMLRRERMNSNYRDPYLYAILKRSGAVAGRDVVDPWFTGPADTERWMRLTRSGAELRCVKEGFSLRGPSDTAYRTAFDELKAKHGVGPDNLVRIPRVARGVGDYDTDDRVTVGVRLLKDLVAMQPSGMSPAEPGGDASTPPASS